MNSTAQGNFFSNQPSSQQTVTKFVVNKNEDRVNKSQQQTRTRTGKSRQHALDTDNLNKLVF